jgi:hypothetical protein
MTSYRWNSPAYCPPVSFASKVPSLTLVAMKFNTFLNLIGLALITFGSIGAALASPSPQYNSDGSVSLGVADINKRIRIYRTQRLFSVFLALVGIGAALQAIALFL